MARRAVKNDRGGTLYPAAPGESANPNGRPKGTPNRATIVRRIMELEQDVTHPITNQTARLNQWELIMLAQLKKARQGDTRAAEFLADSGFGKMPDRVEAGNPGSFDLRDLSDEELEELIRKNR